MYETISFKEVQKEVVELKVVSLLTGALAFIYALLLAMSG